MVCHMKFSKSSDDEVFNWMKIQWEKVIDKQYSGCKRDFQNVSLKLVSVSNFRRIINISNFALFCVGSRILLSYGGLVFAYLVLQSF